jgi:hypothetical protein
MNDENLNNSGTPIAFDPGWRSASSGMQGVVSKFYDLVSQHENAASKKLRPVDIKKRKLAADALVSNVALVHSVRPGYPLAVFRHNAASTYSAVLGAGFNAILDAAVALGLIVQRLGYRNSATSRAPTTIEATQLLIDMLPDNFKREHLRYDAGTALLDLRTEKDVSGYSTSIAIKNTQESHRLHNQMLKINEVTGSPRVTRLGDPVWLESFGGKLRIWSAQRHHLYRVFNNRTLAHGGRMHGGWWQHLSKSERYKSIRIDGETIVELDYRNTFLRLAYAHFGVPWPFNDQDGDAYTALRPPFNPRPEQYRDGWKSLTNALLSARKPMRSWPGDSVPERERLRRALYSQKFSACVKAIREKHSALPNQAWEQGEGFVLTRIESDIMVKILLECRRRDIIVLPVHDALICADGQMHDVATIMLRIAEQETGAVMPLNLLDSYLLGQNVFSSLDHAHS